MFLRLFTIQYITSIHTYMDQGYFPLEISPPGIFPQTIPSGQFPLDNSPRTIPPGQFPPGHYHRAFLP